ncbi:TetR/AcrR family transcriptional regulator [Cellulosimicrobium composti]|uniref:TetR family transcriptional regulator n=1 Tax=Cellulosimicrobium composti TaxID=2672572 RepID=A0ABX0BDF6_9MICO|nr:TetR family transcriptional regulator [Cellulosimicrobium composti]NDO89938.1 TetR family transcriptional regulator [Cellulosimicrobium composti]TWG84996.1 TetR family transcriptional regulator [Cellulosimicrobium cellulans J34]SME93403.1 transcriptional regulator, TetR family [Cellulosimicrobium cellulans J1]
MPTETAPSRPVPRRQARGVARREAIVRAAADLILREGPAAVTHRAVAARADVPLAATTYYFTGLDDLIGAAGEVIVAGWAEHARGAAERAARGGDRARLDAHVLVDAVLPPGGETEVRGFYEHLVGAGRYPALARAYGEGRQGLDDAIAQLLAVRGLGSVPPALVVAVVDGAAVSALSEGHDVRALAVQLVADLVGRDTAS